MFVVTDRSVYCVNLAVLINFNYVYYIVKAIIFMILNFFFFNFVFPCVTV